jgi:hypothetical protein
MPVGDTVRLVSKRNAEDWRAEAVNGTLLFELRLSFGGSLSRWFLLCNGRLVEVGTFRVDLWSKQVARDMLRDVLTAIVQKMCPEVEVIVEGPP